MLKLLGLLEAGGPQHITGWRSSQVSMTGGGLGPAGGWETMNLGTVLYIPMAC